MIQVIVGILLEPILYSARKTRYVNFGSSLKSSVAKVTNHMETDVCE